MLIALPMFGDYYTPNIVSGAPTTSMIGNQIDLYFHGGPQPTIGAAITILLSAFLVVLMGYYMWTIHRASKELRGMSAGRQPPAAESRQEFTPWQRATAGSSNPWGRPRFLVVITWAYMVWAIVPVLIAIQFSFNDSRSRTRLARLHDQVVLGRPGQLGVARRRRCARRSRRASSWPALDVLIATPIGVAAGARPGPLARPRLGRRPTS